MFIRASCPIQPASDRVPYHVFHPEAVNPFNLTWPSDNLGGSGQPFWHLQGFLCQETPETRPVPFSQGPRVGHLKPTGRRFEPEDRRRIFKPRTYPPPIE